MKRTVFFLGFIFILGLWACQSGSSPEDKLFEAIARHVEPDTLHSITVKDTVDQKKVEKNLGIIKQELARIDTIISGIPQQIKEAEERLTNAENELKNLQFKMLKENWENIITTEKVTIEKYREMLVDYNNSKAKNQSMLSFAQKMKDKSVDGIAYYIVEGKVNTDNRTFFVTPAYEVLEREEES